ncbi:ATP-binding cassette domain-containing protein [Microbacterium sp. KNMS]
MRTTPRRPLGVLADVPPAGWAVVALGVLRAVALTGAALAAGAGVDALLQGASAAPALGIALAATAAAALLAGAEALLPPLAQAGEERAWRRAVVAAQLTAPLDDGTPSGDRVARATDDVERAAHYRSVFLGPLIAAFTVPVVVIVAIAVLVSTGIALPIAVCAAAIPPVIAWFLSRFRAGSGRFRMISARLAASFLETLRALGTIRLLGAEGQRRAQLAVQAERMRVEAMRLLRRNQVVLLVTDAIFGVVMLSLVGALAVSGVADGSVSPGAAFALLLLTVPLREPVDRLGRSFYVGLAGRAAAERVRAAIASAPSPASAAPAVAPGGRIRGDGVRVDRGGVRVVDEVDLELAPGLTAIVGPSGSGKSSLALAVAGLLPATGLRIDGREASPEALRAAVAYVPQRSVLLTGTVRDNLLLAAPGASDDDLVAALRAAGLATPEAELPAGLETRVGEGARGVSGGQAQRIAIARALLGGRGALVADEPTASLDRDTADRVLATLRDLARTRAVLLVTHRLPEAHAADRVVVIEGGRVTAAGAPSELALSSGYLAAATSAEEAS